MQLHTYVFLIPSEDTNTIPGITYTPPNNGDNKDSVFLLAPEDSHNHQKFSRSADGHSGIDFVQPLMFFCLDYFYLGLGVEHR